MQNQTLNTGTPVRAVPMRDVHAAYDANRVVASRDFADRRQFTAQGKSQKSLDRQNPPMTIDQVRELLNKNK